MILVHGKDSDSALPIVVTALQRSVTAGLVVRFAGEVQPGSVLVFVNPEAGDADAMKRGLAGGGKVIVLGAMVPEIARLAGLRASGPVPPDWGIAAQCPPAPIHATSQSLASIHWSDHPLASMSPFPVRAFLRFDYANEWNNLGFGRIQADGGPWSIASAAELDGALVLAWAEAEGLRRLPVVTLFEAKAGSVLWWNRPVGPVDSAEWAVIEAFLADWRAEDRPTVPVIAEIPFGYDCAITMRLDCDEDIASARPLFELYRARSLPFSVAIKTAQEDRTEHIALLKEILANGGAVLSHSVTHATNWGGSGKACYLEARGSADWLEQRLPGVTIRHAVSPFHQNPPYVPAAMKQAGISGFVGGIIANDPEALLARGGILPGDSSGVISHSQQCMLHGDCVLAQPDRLAIAKKAFMAARGSGMLFGFLDHPFSPRYDYGWGSEDHRLSCHAEFLDFIAEQTKDRTVLWLNEDQALDWIGDKARLRMVPQRNGFAVEAGANASLPVAVRWRGQTLPLTDFPDVSA